MPLRTLVCRRCGEQALSINGHQPETCESKHCLGEEATWRYLYEGEAVAESIALEVQNIEAAFKLEPNDVKFLQKLKIRVD